MNTYSQTHVSKRGKTTDFKFNDGDFFVALTDAKTVRIGMVGGPACFDVPAGHAWYDRIVEATSRNEVESYFDELVEAFA